MLQVVIFGASGYIGSALAHRLESVGHSVKPVGGPRSADQFDVLADPSALGALIGKGDIVINCAGRAHIRDDDATAFWSANALGAKVVAQACLDQGASRLVHLSSIAVGDIGWGSRALVNHGAQGVYGLSKAAGEHFIAQTLGDSSCDWILVRPGGVYSHEAPGMWGQLLRYAERFRSWSIVPFTGRYSVTAIDTLCEDILSAVEGRLEGRHVLHSTDDEDLDVASFLRRHGYKVKELPPAFTVIFEWVAERLAKIAHPLRSLERQAKNIGSPPTVVR